MPYSHLNHIRKKDPRCEICVRKLQYRIYFRSFHIHTLRTNGFFLAFLKVELHMVHWSTVVSLITRFMGPTWAHLGPVGPRWAPCRPHEPCYLGWYDRALNRNIICMFLGMCCTCFLEKYQSGDDVMRWKNLELLVLCEGNPLVTKLTKMIELAFMWALFCNFLVR